MGNDSKTSNNGKIDKNKFTNLAL